MDPVFGAIRLSHIKDHRIERISTESNQSVGSAIPDHEVIPVIPHRNKDRKSFESVITIVSIPSNNKKVTKSNNKARGSINTEDFSNLEKPEYLNYIGVTN